MSGNRKLTEGSDTCVASQTSGAPSANTNSTQSQWRQERLFEARGILADIAHHPETLVRLACQVICDNSTDTAERGDALGVMRLLRAHRSEPGSAVPKGGAA